MNREDDWQAWQRCDEERRQQEILAALQAAEQAGVPREHIITLAYESGVGEIYNKEATQ
jgi:hypothetical protein